MAIKANDELTISRMIQDVVAFASDLEDWTSLPHVAKAARIGCAQNRLAQLMAVAEAEQAAIGNHK